MICPKCKHPKTKDDFYWKKGTETKAMPDCKYCISEANKFKAQIQDTGEMFNEKEYARLMRF